MTGVQPCRDGLVLRVGREVLADYDLTVLSDITEADPDAADTCDTCGGNREVYHQTEDESWYTGCPEPCHTLKPFYYIGWPDDRDAGIYGGSLDCAPAPFATVEAALVWAAAHAGDISKEVTQE